MKKPPADLIHLTERVILKIHEEEIRHTNGMQGLRNKEGLKSALEQPKATFDDKELYPDVFIKAAVLAHGISEGQVFVDGNKRTGLLTALTFLELNGLALYKEIPEFEDYMIGLSSGKYTKEDFASKLKSLLA